MNGEMEWKSAIPLKFSHWFGMQKSWLNSNKNEHKSQTMEITMKTTKFLLQKTNKERKLIETQLLFVLLEFNGEKDPLLCFSIAHARNQYVIATESVLFLRMEIFLVVWMNEIACDYDICKGWKNKL